MPETSGYRRNRGSRERNQDVRLKTDAVAQQHNECLKYDEYRADTLHRYVICQAEQGNRANVRAHRMLSTKCCLPQQSSSVHPSALGHFRVSASATEFLVIFIFLQNKTTGNTRPYEHRKSRDFQTIRRSNTRKNVTASEGCKQYHAALVWGQNHTHLAPEIPPSTLQQTRTS